jgi:cytochrome c553
MPRRLVAFVLGAALALSCAKPADRGEVKSARSPLGHAGSEPGAPKTPWSSKTHAERLEFMGIFVFPKMKTLFQTESPSAYAHFRCQTCHGEDMEAKGFRLPNSLYALPAEDPVKAALAYDEKTAKFMMDRVVPAMRELLGKDDPATAHGFGCLTCHQKE